VLLSRPQDDHRARSVPPSIEAAARKGGPYGSGAVQGPGRSRKMRLRSRGPAAPQTFPLPSVRRPFVSQPRKKGPPHSPPLCEQPRNTRPRHAWPPDPDRHSPAGDDLAQPTRLLDQRPGRRFENLTVTGPRRAPTSGPLAVKSGQRSEVDMPRLDLRPKPTTLFLDHDTPRTGGADAKRITPATRLATARIATATDVDVVGQAPAIDGPGMRQTLLTHRRSLAPRSSAHGSRTGMHSDSAISIICAVPGPPSG
jgi:hypothetical protein